MATSICDESFSKSLSVIRHVLYTNKKVNTKYYQIICVIEAYLKEHHPNQWVTRRVIRSAIQKTIDGMGIDGNLANMIAYAAGMQHSFPVVPETYSGLLTWREGSGTDTWKFRFNLAGSAELQQADRYVDYNGVVAKMHNGFSVMYYKPGQWATLRELGEQVDQSAHSLLTTYLDDMYDASIIPVNFDKEGIYLKRGRDGVQVFYNYICGANLPEWLPVMYIRRPICNGCNRKYTIGHPKVYKCHLDECTNIYHSRCFRECIEHSLTATDEYETNDSHIRDSEVNADDNNDTAHDCDNDNFVNDDVHDDESDESDSSDSDDSDDDDTRQVEESVGDDEIVCRVAHIETGDILRVDSDASEDDDDGNASDDASEDDADGNASDDASEGDDDASEDDAVEDDEDTPHDKDGQSMVDDIIQVSPGSCGSYIDDEDLMSGNCDRLATSIILSDETCEDEVYPDIPQWVSEFHDAQTNATGEANATDNLIDLFYLPEHDGNLVKCSESNILVMSKKRERSECYDSFNEISHKRRCIM